MNKFSLAAVTASIRRRRKELRMINPVIKYGSALAFKMYSCWEGRVPNVGGEKGIY